VFELSPTEWTAIQLSLRCPRGDGWWRRRSEMRFVALGAARFLGKAVAMR